MINIFRHAYDPLADELQRRMGRVVQSCVVEQLVTAYRIEHQQQRGKTTTRLTAQAGLPVWSNEPPALVINRVRNVPGGRIGWANARDAGYAASEANALFWSMLRGYDCPVLNSPGVLRGFEAPVADLAWFRQAAHFGIQTRQIVVASNIGRVSTEHIKSIAPAMKATDLVNRGPICLASELSGQVADAWLCGGPVHNAAEGSAPGKLVEFGRAIGTDIARLTFVITEAGPVLAGVEAMPSMLPVGAIDLLCGEIDRLCCLPG